MIDILFFSTPKFLFEPIAAAALIGGVWAIVAEKQRGTLYWFVLYSIVFMLMWRCGYKIITGRYSAVLIYAAAIAAAYGCLKSGEILNKFSKLSGRSISIIQWCLVSLLALGCIAKAMRYNPYHDHIAKAGRIIAADAAGYKKAMIACAAEEIVRLKYYSGLPTQTISNETPQWTGKHDLLSDLFVFFANNCDVGYFVRFESALQKPLEDLKEIPLWFRKNIQLISESYHNKKKRRYTRVYRCRISDIHKECKLSLKYAPEKKAETQPPAYRFTFDKVLPDNNQFYRNAQKYFQSRGLYVQIPILKKFPSAWTLYGTPGYAPGSDGKLGVVSAKCGSNVFRIKGNDRITVYTVLQYPVKKYTLKMRGYGTNESVFGLGFHTYHKNNFYASYYSLPPINLKKDAFFEYSVSVPKQFFNSDISWCRPTVDLLKGELQILSIELYFDQQGKK